MAKRNKIKKYIMIIIMMLLLLATGYAAFSDSLKIQGTANAKGTFDLEFQNAQVVRAVGVNERETTSIISQQKYIM